MPTSDVLVQRARILRKEQTLFERQLWQQLRARHFSQFKFRRQHPMGCYIADFICFTPGVVIELDGGQHAERQFADAKRDAWFAAQGYRVVRIWNNQWITERESVLQRIWDVLHHKD